MSTSKSVKLCVAAVALAACSSADDEFDRHPVVKSATAGPLRARFYASPTSEGGAATRFRVGEHIYVVNTLENASHEEQTCSLDGSLLMEWGFPATRVLRQDHQTVWEDSHSVDAIVTFGLYEEPPVDIDGLPPIAIAADLVTRKAVKVKTKPLPPGQYEVEWSVPPLGLHDVWDAEESNNLLMLVCGYPLSVTSVSIGISIEAAD